LLNTEDYSAFPDEEEVLLQEGLSFIVENISNKKTSYGFYYKEVHLVYE
jgi:hypothetical protein